MDQIIMAKLPQTKFNYTSIFELYQFEALKLFTNLKFCFKTDELGLQLSSKIIFCFWGYFFSIKPMKII